MEGEEEVVLRNMGGVLKPPREKKEGGERRGEGRRSSTGKSSGDKGGQGIKVDRVTFFGECPPYAKGLDTSCPIILSGVPRGGLVIRRDQ